MFCENIVTLIGWICKNYSTFGLFNIYCLSLFLFFIFIFSCHWFVPFKVAMQLQYFGTVRLTYFTVQQQCSCNSPFVSWVILPFFFFPFFFLTLLFKFCIVATVPLDTVATVVAFFSLPFVFFYIYCYTDTTNFTIFSQLLTCQFLTSRNKIIKYETVTNHSWK